MRTLQKAREERYGKPEVAEVSYTTTPGKAILVVGSNIRELEDVLEAVKGKEIDVYTHDEMMLANTFPQFRQYSNLKGQYGQGIENCLLDFATFPGPIILTRHSLYNVEHLYRGLLYTTDFASSKGVIPIKDKDFSGVIESAEKAKGFKTGRPCETVTIGFNYDEVIAKYEQMSDWLAGLYVNVLNLIQYMHDKYYYEAAQMSLIDTDLKRTFATGIAGFSHVVDSLSAIKYAKVKTIRDEDGIVVDYEVEGDFPRYGNDDDRADDIAVWLLGEFLAKIKKHHTYRDSEPTTSILTITSNVVYGKATGSLPDGRKAGEPLSPGANPSYGAEQNGLLASLNSVAKLPYEWALDGISNTQTINPDALGHDEGERVNNLVQVMDGYFEQGAHHLNVNVFGTEKLIDAMEHPEKEEYANFTIRVSGYAVKFIDLTREQQLDVIARTCHEHM